MSRHSSEGWELFTTAERLVIQFEFFLCKSRAELDPNLRWDDEQRLFQRCLEGYRLQKRARNARSKHQGRAGREFPAGAETVTQFPFM